MQVFKAYFKIMKKHAGSFLIYFIIFFAISTIISVSLKGQTSMQFSEAKSNVAVINEDGDSPLVQGLSEYLSSNAVVIDIKDNTEDIQDALFCGEVDCVFRIPEGFSQSFMSGNQAVPISKVSRAVSAESVNLDMLINKYLNLAGLYVKNEPGIKAQEVKDSVLNNLSVSSSADFSSNAEQREAQNLSYYFRILAYSILAIMITGVTTVMMSFNEKNLSMRNRCSSITTWSMNLQMVLANIFFALLIWVGMCAFTFIMYGRFALSGGIALLCLNALTYTAASLGIGFLIGKFVTDHIVQAALTTVVSLGMSFISGVFVSQDLLGSKVLKVASFTPGYWYIKAVLGIRTLPDLEMGSLQPIINCMLIQLGFAAAFIIIALAVSKQKRTNTAA